MQAVRAILLVVGVGLAASTLTTNIAYMRMGGIRGRDSDKIFATGCMLIAQYFV